MPRHDQKAYTNVIARLPQELADALKRYAAQHRCTVSELIRDGVEMRLGTGDIPGRSPGSRDDMGAVMHEVLQAITPMVRAWIEDAVQAACSEVIQGMTQGFPSPPYPGTPDLEEHTEVRPQKRRARAH